jgi:hypothetical protein
MPDLKKTTMTKRLPLTGATTSTTLTPLRAGMPAMDSIHQVTTFKPKAAGPTYQIIKTTETDSYDTAPAVVSLTKKLRTKGPIPSAAIAAVSKAKPKGDNFTGKDRKAAKLSKGTGKLEKFKDLKDLVASLTPDSKMVNHKPKITIAATSGRVTEEQRNVSVTAFLYAAKAEADCDRHCIVGRDPKLSPEIYMTMELSGLPPKNAATFAELSAARATFKKFFAGHDPGMTYEFYNPPVPVTIEGSLFFDMTHATGGGPGPQSLKSRMPTIWEVHPITSIKLG